MDINGPPRSTLTEKRYMPPKRYIPFSCLKHASKSSICLFHTSNSMPLQRHVPFSCSQIHASAEACAFFMPPGLELSSNTHASAEAYAFSMPPGLRETIAAHTRSMPQERYMPFSCLQDLCWPSDTLSLLLTAWKFINTP